MEKVAAGIPVSGGHVTALILKKDRKNWIRTGQTGRTGSFFMVLRIFTFAVEACQCLPEYDGKCKKFHVKKLKTVLKFPFECVIMVP